MWHFLSFLHSPKQLNQNIMIQRLRKCICKPLDMQWCCCLPQVVLFYATRCSGQWTGAEKTLCKEVRNVTADKINAREKLFLYFRCCVLWKFNRNFAQFQILATVYAGYPPVSPMLHVADLDGNLKIAISLNTILLCTILSQYLCGSTG